MDLLSMCRICTVNNVRMHYLLNSNLEETFEKLTNLQYETKGRPAQVCYICYAKLQNCYQLRVSCLQSEELFYQMLVNSECKPLQKKNTLQMVHPPVIECSIAPEASTQINNQTNIKYNHRNYEERLKHTVKVKQEISEALEDQKFKIKSEAEDIDSDDGSKDDVMDYNTRPIKAEDFLVCELSEVNVEYNGNIQNQNKEGQNKGYFKTEGEVTRNESTRSNFVWANKPSGVELTPIPKKPKLPEPEKYPPNAFLIKPEIEETVIPNKNIFKQIQIIDEAGVEREVVASPHLDSIQYKCGICEKSFSVKSNLLRHFRTHTDEKPFKCDKCDKSFRNKCHLNSHLRIHTGIKPFKCETCGKCFNRMSALSTHIRIHTGEKPFKCEICDKGFIIRSHLTCHVRTHTGEKPFKCDTCEKSFIDRSHLNSHIRIHTGEKPYKCPVCEKCFNHRSALSGHVRTHTGEKPYKCEKCQKSFSDKRPLHKHMVTVHGENPSE